MGRRLMISLRKWAVTTREGKSLLSEASFDLAIGSVLGVYGPNGSGKSSLLKSISGIIDRDRLMSGEFWIDQLTNLLSATPIERVKQILYLGSDFSTPFDLTVRELLEMGSLVGSSQMWPVVSGSERARISHVVEAMHLTEFLPRVVSTLSDGEKQLVMFARCLIQKPRVLVLDESFSKLDLDHLLQVARLIRTFAKEGMTFLVASHDLNFLSEMADELLFLRQSKMIAKGFVADLFMPSVLNELYPGLPLQVVRSPESGKHKVLY
jgi:iron complex transport system ATP-binding protein